MKRNAEMKSESPGPSQDVKVLIVDDQREIRDVLRIILEGVGYTVEEAVDCKEGERLLQSMSFDIVITDIILPRFNGLDILRKAKEIQPDTPVVIITGYPCVDTAIEALRLGAYDYVTKPISVDTLTNVTRRAAEIKRLKEGKKRVEEENDRYKQHLERLVEEKIQKIKDIEAIYQYFYNHCPVMLCSMDKKGNLISTNLRWLEETGWNWQEAVGRQADVLMPSAPTQPPFSAVISSVWKDAYIRSIPYSFLKKDGKVIDVLLDCVAATDPSGVDICLCLFQNVTEHKRAEEALRESEKNLHAMKDILEHLNIGLIAFDLVNPSVIFQNNYATDILKSTRVSPNYKSLLSLFISDLEKELHSSDSNIQKQIELENQIIGYTVHRILDRYVWIFFRDITEKLRLESVVEALNTVNNIGYIFTGIRHEIGNPVNSIKTTLNVLSRNIDSYSKEKVAEYVDRALTEIGRIEYLLKALKTFNMYENPDFQNVHIPSFVENLGSLVSEDFKKNGISIKTIIHPEVKQGYTDPRALHQVMLNILTNSSDALEGREDPRILINVFRISDRVMLRVVDNGCGMSSDQQKELFKPFYTTKVRGTGLGLVIVKKMLAKMNSTIDIDSQEDAGTIVDITIPEGKDEYPRC